MAQHETQPPEPDAPSDDEISDDELVASASEDLGALAVIYDRYAERVYRYLLARTSDIDLADDVTADSLAQALARVDQFHPGQGGDPFATWLFRLVGRRLEEYRRGRIRPIGAGVETRAAVAAMFEQAPLAEILAGLERLPTADRQVIALHCVAELSPDETARLLDIPEDAFHPRLQQALDALTLAMEFQYES
jgi:RNA polymerase sigma-70 factor, ECF subfamily